MQIINTKPQDTEFEHATLGLLARSVLSQGKSAVNTDVYGLIMRHQLNLLHSPQLIENEDAELYTALTNSELRSQIEDRILQLESQHIFLLGYTSPRYPELLRQIYLPPTCLFYKGQWPHDTIGRAVAVVGARAANQEGCNLALEMAKGLAQERVCVVSGLALGIDASAHLGAISADFCSSFCPTIAVLGNGLSRVYPARHEGLAAQILERGGLLVSQFDPDTPPYPSNFLDRNRVISGISEGVLVVQANTRSGSLVTARHALDEGREVMAIPGSPLESLHKGTNHLIKQGASCVTTVEDLFEILDIKRDQRPKTHDKYSLLSSQQLEIVSYLKKNGKQQLAALIHELAPNNSNLHLDLLELELAQIVYKLPGNILTIKP